MPKRLPTAQEVADKWSSRASGASSEYAREARESASDWESNTRAAAANYKAAVSQGGIEARFAGGVARAGSAKYSARINDVGMSRYSEGVSKGKDAMREGASQVLQDLGSVQYPPRGIKGADANLLRVNAVAKTLRDKALARKAAGR